MSSLILLLFSLKVVEDGYEFFAKRQLVTLFSAPNYCGEFDNAGAMMSVDETLMCSFQVWYLKVLPSCLYSHTLRLLYFKLILYFSRTIMLFSNRSLQIPHVDRLCLHSCLQKCDKPLPVWADELLYPGIKSSEHSYQPLACVRWHGLADQQL